ncbi:TPA: HD domain-containing protein [Candidatus Scatousia excrementigallinarum]|uniref:HD domain-containing protein n=1 Tax=Candidatus Scatousia excrementigallinarum TaxID=2840935 RepID=A0A9D1JNU7_9BACT|nr:HD domain-containing protein [Candidatus Scatousia excrementigallinarum]
MNTLIKDKITSDKILSKITASCDNEIYIVGGTVRDFLTGKESFDRDIIVTDEDAKDFALKIQPLFDAVFVPLDEVNKIYRLVLQDKVNYIDITNPLEGSLHKDLMRRDLTINAVAVNVRTCEIIDLCGGITDIHNRTINYINEHNFEDDPLRLLRVYRFQAALGFELTPETIHAVCKFVKLIHKPAVERIIHELILLFGGKYADKALLNMNKTWLLEEIFPVVKELKQVPPNTHHHLDLFHHSVETVRQIQLIYENSADKVKEHLERVDFGGATRLAHLKLAGFLHDIGKFSTWTIEEDTGRHRFIKHDDVGAKMSIPLLKKMNFSNKQIEYISSMIRNHIYPSQVMCAPEINDKIMMRYVRKMEDNSIDEIILAQADRLSARGEAVSDEMVENNISGLNRLLKFYLDVRDTLEPLPVLLDGNDVIKILNIKPSKQLGQIMNALHEAQLSGDITTKEQAEAFVKSFYQNLNG